MIRPLTSLRFFFAFIVFFSHLKFLENTSNPVFHKLHLNLLMDGHLGVSFFFVLSGFILAYSYQDKLQQGKTTHKQFWAARFARIYPLHLATLLLALGLTAYTNTVLQKPLVVLVSQLTLTQSFWPAKEVFYSLNAPAWSISSEAFFYFMFPYLIVYFSSGKKKLRYALFATLLLAVPVLMTFVKGEISYWLFYINPVFRVLDFALGIVLYEAYKQMEANITAKRANIMEMAFVLLMLLFIAGHNQIGFVYRLSCYYWLPMCLVILAFSFQKGLLSRMLSKNLFIVLGEISFAFYLVHMLVIQWLEELNNTFHLTNSHLPTSIAMFAVSLAAAYFLHKYIELPLNAKIKTLLNAKPKKAVEKEVQTVYDVRTAI